MFLSLPDEIRQIITYEFHLTLENWFINYQRFDYEEILIPIKRCLSSLCSNIL